MDMDHRGQNSGGRSGRVIMLGDGTEVLTDQQDSEMFDNGDEDKDLESQVTKGKRDNREGTPGPSPTTEMDHLKLSASPNSL